jgi:dihydroflavonol-4-reductase
MKALVTGGTGFVGGAVVRELLRRGHEVRVLARATSKTGPLEKMGAGIAYGDILDGASIARALKGCDTLFHAAAIYEFWVQDRGLLMRTDVEGSRNAMEAAIAAGVARVVYTSTSVVVGEAKGEVGNEKTVRRGYFLSPYEEAKYQAEQVVKQYRDRLKIAIIRPVAVLGAGDRKPTGQAIVNLLNGRIPGLFSGYVTFVDAGDVAAAHVLAAELERWGEDYIVAAEILPLADLLRLACRLGGVHPPPAVPCFVARWFAMFEEWKSRRTGKPPILPRDMFELVVHGFQVDGGKAARELGIQYTPIKESLRQAICWYWEQGLLKRKPACVAQK